MSSSEPRRPTTGPGSTSQKLSERIAALQRKASSGSTENKPRPTSPSYRSTSDSYLDSNQSSTNGDRSSPTSPRSTSSLHPSSAVGGGGGGGVRDRIARFQSNSSTLTEKPLVPRSSFGAPAPNPELSKSVRKAYPGASGGGGTGAWGEGVLMPQLTGGAWGGNTSQSLRPQLTGGAWAAAQSARDYNANPSNRWKPKEGDGSSLNVPLASPTNSTIRGAGKDAFAELDEENRISTKLNQGSSSKVAPPLDFNSLNLASEEGLPNLPDAPKTEINIPEGTATFDSDLEVDERQNPIPSFPDPPSSLPKSPSPPSSDAIDSPGAFSPVEIGINSPNPGGVEAIRARVASGSSSKDPEAPLSEARTSALFSGSKGSLDLPARAGVERTDSGRVDSSDPAAHEVMGPELLVARDEVADAQAQAAEVGEGGSGQEVQEPPPVGMTQADLEAYRSGVVPSSSSGSELATSAAKIVAQRRMQGHASQESGVLDPEGLPSDLISKSSSARSGFTNESEGTVIASGSRGTVGGKDESYEADASLNFRNGDDTFGNGSASRNGSGTGLASSAIIKERSPGHNISRSSSPEDNYGDATSNSERRRRRNGNSHHQTPSGSSSHQKSESFNSQSSNMKTPVETNLVDRSRLSPTALSPTQSPTSTSSTSPQSSINAARAAREAIMLGRTKSQQKIRRLPPGRTLSAAEMDASDDDYEPGWANVISRT